MAFSGVKITTLLNGSSSVTGYRDDLSSGDTVIASLTSTLGVATFLWELVGRPEGSASGGSGPEPINLGTSATATFVVDDDSLYRRDGTYVLQCTVNAGLPTETRIRVLLARLSGLVLPGGRHLRKPGGLEAFPDDDSNALVEQGWATQLDRWLEYIRTLSVGGGGANPSLTFITKANETSGLPNSIGLATLGGPGLLKFAADGTPSKAIVGTDYQAAGSYITALTGDVTATGPGSAAATIATHAVTYAKVQQAGAGTLLGNPTGGTANVEEVTLGPGLTFSGTTITTVGEVATWPLNVQRFFAADAINGSDANVGYSDVSEADAGTKAVKTLARLYEIIPKNGAGRSAKVVIANGGVNTAATYTDGLPTIGLNGYNIFGIIGTGTQPNAGAVAFDGSANTDTYAGGITVPGLSSTGYNPTGSPTTTSWTLQVNGGGAPALPAEPAAPLGWRVRFDINTTTASLRGLCKQISQVNGSSQITINGTSPLPTPPSTSDVFYIEKAGVVVGATTISVTVAGLFLPITGMDMASGLTILGGVPQISFSGASTLNLQAPAGLQTISVWQGNFPSANRRPGGGLVVSGTTASSAFGGARWASVSSITHVGTAEILDPLGGLNIGDGVTYAAGVALHGSTMATQHSDGFDSFGSPASNGLLRITGSGSYIGGAGDLVLRGTNIAIRNAAMTGAGSNPVIKAIGQNRIMFAGTASGSTGNNDVGLDLTASYDSSITILTLPTVTGALGDVRLADGTIVTWTQASNGIIDSHGNRIVSSGYPFTMTPAGVAFAQLAAGGIVQAAAGTGILSPTTIGAGLTFSGGTLRATGPAGAVAFFDGSGNLAGDVNQLAWDDTNHRLYVSSTNPAATGTMQGQLNIQTDGGAGESIWMSSDNAGTIRNEVIADRSKGTSRSSPSATTAGTMVWDLASRAHDGSSYVSSLMFGTMVPTDGTVATNSVPQTFFIATNVAGGVTSATASWALAATARRNVFLGEPTIATNATDGFAYIPAAAGAPSGTPTYAFGGSQVGNRIPLYFDQANVRLDAYVGGWKVVGQYDGSFGPAIVQTDASGIHSAVTIGTGLTYSGGTLSATAASGITQLTGDVTAGPGSGSQAATIATHAVSYPKIQQVGAHSLLGNPTGSAADVSEITLGSGLSFSGTTLTATGSGGSVTSVSGTAPIVITGSPTTTPTVTLAFDGTSLTLNGSNQLQVAAFTGDVTRAAGGTVTTLANIPSGVPAAGTINFAQVAAPAAPAVGHLQVWADATNGGLWNKGSGGFTTHTFASNGGSANKWVSALNDDGSVTLTQPSFANISGTVSAAQLGSFTNGSVIFWNSGLAQDNVHLFFDSTNLRLGVGNVGATPVATLHAAVVATPARGVILAENAASGVGDYVEIGLVNNLSYASRASIYYTSSNYTGAGGATALIFQNANGPIAFQGNGASSIGLTITKNATNVPGDVQVARLSAGGLVKAASSSGQLGIATSGDVATTLTFPAANEVLYSAGTNVAPAGDALFKWDPSNRGLVVGDTALFAGSNKLYVLPASSSTISASYQHLALYVASQVQTLSAPTHVTTATGVNTVQFGGTTYTASGAMTIDNAATLAITGQPLSSSSGGAAPTITNAYALWVQAGAVRFDGAPLTLTGSDASAVTIALTKAADQEIDKVGGTLWVGTHDANQLGFYTNNTNRMEISAAGAVHIDALGSGIVKATSGTLGIASAGTDYLVQAYTTVDAAGSALTQRSILNFTSDFSAVDNSGASRTDVALATVGPGTGTYGGTGAYLQSVSLDSKGRVTAVTTQASFAQSTTYKWSMYTSGFSGSGILSNLQSVTVAADTGAANQTGIGTLVAAPGTTVQVQVAGTWGTTSAVPLYPVHTRANGGGVFTISMPYALASSNAAGATLRFGVWFTTDPTASGAFSNLAVIDVPVTSSVGGVVNSQPPTEQAFATAVPAGASVFVEVHRIDTNGAVTVTPLIFQATLELYR